MGSSLAKQLRLGAKHSLMLRSFRFEPASLLLIVKNYSIGGGRELAADLFKLFIIFYK